jgi:hypothetical protein
MRGDPPVIVQMNTGVRPTPVRATSRTACVRPSPDTSVSATLRILNVPLGISGSLPSDRGASGTEYASGVSPSGEQWAMPATVCPPSSKVDLQRTRSPSRWNDVSALLGFSTQQIFASVEWQENLQKGAEARIFVPPTARAARGSAQ